MTLFSFADIVGDGAAHAISGSGSAHWIQFIAPDTNTSTVRVGDASVSTSRGLAIAPGGGLLLPIGEANPDRNYQLSAIYYIVQSGDKLNIVIGQ